MIDGFLAFVLYSFLVLNKFPYSTKVDFQCSYRPQHISKMSCFNILNMLRKWKINFAEKQVNIYLCRHRLTHRFPVVYNKDIWYMHICGRPLCYMQFRINILTQIKNTCWCVYVCFAYIYFWENKCPVRFLIYKSNTACVCVFLFVYIH